MTMDGCYEDDELEYDCQKAYLEQTGKDEIDDDYEIFREDYLEATNDELNYWRYE